MIKRAIKKVVKTAAIEAGVIFNSNKGHAEELAKIERVFKRQYKVEALVKYVDMDAREFITNKATLGRYNAQTKTIIVFLNGDLDRNAETLLHELTHAYQHQRMTRTFNKSVDERKSGKETYRNCWHERHARHCARLLVETFDFTLDLNNAFNYAIA